MADNDQDSTGSGQGGGGDPAQGGQGGQGGQGSAQGSGQQAGEGGGQSSQTPATQAKAVTLKLNPDQVARLLKDGTLEISDDLFSGAVKDRMAQLTARAKSAERRLGEIAATQEEAERKALEEQERFKDLYEKERMAREKDAISRKDDLLRFRFEIAATKAGIVDPQVAFIVAKSLPAFSAVAISDDGQVGGIDELVQALVAEKPYLVSMTGKPQTMGAASNPSQQQPPPPKTLAEAGDQLEQAMKTGTL